MERIRRATLRYFIRPVAAFDEFRDQVVGLVETAAGSKCHLLVFPGYFTIRLLTLRDPRRPMPEQIGALATQRERFVELLGALARKYGLHVVGGTIPVIDDGDERVSAP